MYGNLLASATVGSGGAALIEFNAIPDTYTDLILVYSGRSSTTSTSEWGLQANGDSTTNKVTRYVIFNPNTSSAQSYVDTLPVAGGTGKVPVSSTTANTFGSVKIYIPNYATTARKVYSYESVAENNATTMPTNVFNDFGGCNLGITSAITSLSIRFIVAGSLAMNQYSTAYLYGLTRGSGGATVS
jgi:hypothetical protein